MEKYIPKTYEMVSDMLEPVINQYNLDKITIESMIRSSVEFEEQEIQPVTAVWKFKNGKTYSTKASNIKINLKFALSSVFRLKSILEEKDIWIGIAIIHLIVDSFIMAVQEIDEISSVVLIAVYRLVHGDTERLRNYVEKICPPNLKQQLTLDCMEDSLKKLESWGCISCSDGIYMVNETITASMIKKYPEN